MNQTHRYRRMATFAFLMLAFAVVPGQALHGPVKHANARAAKLQSVLDPILEDAIARQKIPGAVLVVGHSGRVVYRKAYGLRSLEPTREPMTMDTIFDLASLTKCVATTMSVMKLMQDGLVRLNDPVSAYLPEFAQNGKQDITVRELLTHYSGLARIWI